MADKFINDTGLAVIVAWIKQKFALDSDLDALDAKVDQIIAEGGEPNVIETVKVNGTALTPVNKAVDVTVPTEQNIRTYAEETVDNMLLLGGDDTPASKGYVNDAVSGITVPTKTSDLTNDGDGQSNFATEDYVDQNGGKIDSISIDGTAQTIDANKNVALDLSDYAKDADLPTNVSDLTDDVGIQTASDVSTAISTALANSNDPYQTESDVDSKISTAVSSAYKYKGSVATVNDLPASGNTTGDVYDVQSNGMNYAWNGSAWDALGTYVDTSVLWTSTSGQSNSLLAMTTAEINAILEPSA